MGREGREVREEGRGERPLAPSLPKLGFPPSLQRSVKSWMLNSTSMVKFSGITSPIRPPTLRNITSSNVER